MKKKLPSIKKSLIDFATKEDAKVMDSAFTKVALMGSVLTLGLMDDTNAFLGSSTDHYNHGNHTNYLSVPKTDIHNREYPDHISNPDNFEDGGRDAKLQAHHRDFDKLNVELRLLNPSENPSSIRISLPTGMGWHENDFTRANQEIIVPKKSVVAHHANHYNTINESHGGW